MDTALNNDLPPPCHHEVELFRNHFVQRKAHPCHMARTLLDTNRAQFRVYTHLGSFTTARNISDDVCKFLAAVDTRSDELHSFVALFTGEKDYNEIAFELLMWQQLQALQEADDGNGWSTNEGDHQGDTDFSFNIAGEALYVVGMHPENSCLARRAPVPAMVFHLHSPFRKLQEENSYERLRSRMRQRDLGLQGAINPIIKGAGTPRKAHSFSGKRTETKSKCYFSTLGMGCPLSE